MLAFLPQLKHWFSVLMLFLLLIAPSIIISTYSYTTLHYQLTQQTYNQRKTLAQQMAITVEARLDAIRDVGKTSAGDIVQLAKADQWTEAVEEIKHVSTEFPYVDRIFLSDLAGRTVAYFPESPENVNKDFSFRDWYKGVSKNWEPYASEVFKRAPTPQYNTVAMMSPIKDTDGTVYGAIGFAINLNSFYELTKNFKVDNGGFLYIVNQKGQIVAHPKYDAHGPIIDYTSVPIVQKLLRSESGVEISFNPIEKEERLAAYVPITKYHWGVIVADPITTAFTVRDTTLRGLLLTESLLIVFNAILAIIFIRALQGLRSSREKLRQGNERFEFVTEATKDAIYDWDITTNSLYFGKGMYTLFKYSREQVQETLEWWTKQLHPDDADRINQQLAEALKSDQNSFQLNYRFKKADGSYTEVIDKAYLVRDADKHPIRYIGVMQDVSETKRYEQELRTRTEEAERLNKIMVDRELKMIELKDELKILKAKTL